ncbi:MAG: MFS transporter [Candidatus Thorarchaeota archaeon]
MDNNLPEKENLGYYQKIQLINRDAKLTIISTMGFAFSWGINDVIFNLYLLERGYTEDFIGFLLSISLFVAASLAIVAGIYTDRKSRKNTILIGSVLVVLATVLLYTTLSPILLLVAQGVLGIGWALQNVSWTPYTMSVTTEEERVHLFSIRFAFWIIANFFGFIIGGYIPGFLIQIGLASVLTASYQLTLYIGITPLIVSLLAIILMSKDTPLTEDRTFSFRNMENSSFIWKYTSHWTITGLGAGFFIMFMNIFFSRAFNVDSSTIGLIFGINTIVLASANFLYPILTERIGKVWTIIGSQSMSIPFLMMLAWSPTIGIAALAYICRNVFMNVQLPVMEVFFMDGLKKEEQSTAMGLINTGDAAARGIGMNVGGILLAAGLFRTPFVFASIFYIIGVLLFYWFFGRTSHEEEGLHDHSAISELA